MDVSGRIFWLAPRPSEKPIPENANQYVGLFWAWSAAPGAQRCMKSFDVLQTEKVNVVVVNR